ncbi:MAG: ACT domain-containing protein [Candidatus Omnitrophota bacterium]
MANVAKIKEILATTENKVGVLAQVSSVIAKAGANITAICACGKGDKAKFMIVTDDNQKAVAALKEKGYDVKEEEAVKVLLENKAGALQEMGEKLAGANIDLSHIYGTVGEGNRPAAIIFSSNNDDKAIDLLK